MATRYRCPNSSCTHEFDPAQLVGVNSVTCPLCGMVIQLRAALTPASAPEAPAPMAEPVASARASASTAPTLPEPAAPVGAPIVRARQGPKEHDWITYTVLIGLFLVLVGLGVGAALQRMLERPKQGSGNEAMKNTDLNVSFGNPGGDWQRNNSLRDKMPVSLLAYQRVEPPAWFALDARDFRDHDPTPKELDDEARARLNGYFQNVETEPGKAGPLKESDLIAGQPTHIIVFQADLDGDHVAGEAHSFHFQGIGYWVYVWKPGTVDNRNDAEFPALRKRVAILGDRAKWKELEQRRQAFTGEKLKGFSLTDTTGRWKKVEPADAHDPAADLVLFAADPKDPKFGKSKGVFLIVMSIPKKGDAVAAAREHVLEMQKRQTYDMTKITDASEEGAGSREVVGDAKGHLLRWRIDNTADLVQFALVGVVPRDKDILVLYGQCDWSKRATWEGQLQSIMETLKVQE